tara:strand:+ start:2777 stop:3163 length:387 start_codon:yes stop_codon:yes gene_type:complete
MSTRRPKKKPPAKKPPAKKPTAKKPTAKKPTAKKPPAKKPTAKKPTAIKKVIGKKTATKNRLVKNLITKEPPKIKVKRRMYEYEKIATNAKGNLFHVMGQRVQRGELKWAYYTTEEGDVGYHYYIKLK